MMGFRERRAWAELAAWAVPFAIYFALAPGGEPTDITAMLRRLAGFAAATIGYGILLGAGTLWSMRGAPRHERSKPDERERAIEWRATSYGYGVMMAGMILVGIVLPFERSGWAITNAALAAIVVSEMVRLTAVAVLYRRGG